MYIRQEQMYEINFWDLILKNLRYFQTTDFWNLLHLSEFT